MNAGIEISDETFSAFEHMKKQNKCIYVMYRIENDNVVVAETLDEQDEYNYEEIQERIASIEGHAYVTFLYKGRREDGGVIDKVIFVHWAPNKCNVKDRMMYASTKNTVLMKFQGIQGKIFATEKAELEEKEVRDAK